MTQTHTPGPWIADGTVIRTDDDPYKRIFIATIVAACPQDQAHADARLIASAPDMCADHKRIDETLTFALENGDMPANVRHSVQFARDIARAAIAKATGKAQ